jgi:hypothetical protein
MNSSDRQPGTRDERLSRGQLDESGAPVTEDDLSLEHRQRLEEDQRHNRDRDLEYRQGGDLSDENGDPTLENADDLRKRAGANTAEFTRTTEDLEDDDLERERLKASSSQ